MQDKNSPLWKFSARFSLAIKQSNLTQMQIAKALNVSEQTICRYKKGGRAADLRGVCRLAKFFGVSTDWLLGAELAGNESIWQQRALAAEDKLAKMSTLISLLEELKTNSSQGPTSG